MECGLKGSLPLVVGVSGGPDSLALLDVLHRLNVDLIVAHLNHHLRPEADADARWVEERARQMGVPCEIGDSDVAKVARDERLSVEEAGRNERYRFLFSVARDYRAQAVAVAHTADDQVETVLMHLLRGSGMAGLRGMPYRTLLSQWSAECPLVRPFLAVWRRETEAYCAERGLSPRMDASNEDTTLYRNRLRHELIPHLESYNAGFKEHIWQTARLLQDDYEMLGAQIEYAWGRCLVGKSDSALLLRRDTFASLGAGLQRQILRKGIQQLEPGLRDVGYEAIERGRSCALAARGSGERADLAGGLFLESGQEEFLIFSSGRQFDAPWWPLLSQDEELELPVPGVARLGNGWEIAAGEAPGGEILEVALYDPDDAWLEARRVAKPLRVRTRRTGDRFQPFGMKSPVKLADFMMNEHVARSARSRWPLVVDASGTIVWVPGFRPSGMAHVRTEKARILHLTLRKG